MTSTCIKDKPGLFEVQETASSVALEAFPHTHQTLSLSYITVCHSEHTWKIVEWKSENSSEIHKDWCHQVCSESEPSHRSVHREIFTFFTMKFWFNAHSDDLTLINKIFDTLHRRRLLLRSQPTVFQHSTMDAKMLTCILTASPLEGTLEVTAWWGRQNYSIITKEQRDKVTKLDTVTLLRPRKSQNTAGDKEEVEDVQ